MGKEKHGPSPSIGAFKKLYDVVMSKGNVEAAKAVKRASEEWRGMQEILEKENPSIKDVVKKWKSLQSTTSCSIESISSLLASEDADSDSSSSSSSSQSSRKSATLNTGSKTRSDNSSVSEDESSSDESESSSESESDASECEASAKSPKLKNGENRPPNPKSSSSSSSSTSSDDDDSDSESGSESSSSVSESDSEKEGPPTKKRKTEKEIATTKTEKITEEKVDSKPNGVEVSSNVASNGSRSTSSPATTSTPNTNKNGKKERQPRKSIIPFQRIKVEEIKFANDRLKDNSFHSRGAKTGDYGERAHADLIVTRGDSFRKEKNKKKRGSYRGGEITLESHSIKFT